MTTPTPRRVRVNPKVDEVDAVPLGGRQVPLAHHCDLSEFVGQTHPQRVLLDLACPEAASFRTRGPELHAPSKVTKECGNRYQSLIVNLGPSAARLLTTQYFELRSLR